MCIYLFGFIFTLERIMDIARDPIVNAVNDGIRRGISVAIDNGCFGSAVILIYSGIDAMGFLGMPKGQEDVTRFDFMRWADKYIRFPCKEQVSGADLYGARCGMLHNYSAFSKMTRQGQCRTIGYMDKSVPEVRYEPNVSKSLVLVSVTGLAAAFFNGIDRYLVDLFSTRERATLAEERLRKLVHCLPVPPEEAKG